MRTLILLVFACTIIGCDPAKYAKFSVAPTAVAASDSSARAETFALVTRIGMRNGLRMVGPADAAGHNDQGWETCLTRETLFLCGKVSGPEIQFEMRQGMSARFTPWADSLRREIVDSLRSKFGTAAVR